MFWLINQNNLSKDRGRDTLVNWSGKKGKMVLVLTYNKVFLWNCITSKELQEQEKMERENTL